MKGLRVAADLVEPAPEAWIGGTELIAERLILCVFGLKVIVNLGTVAQIMGDGSVYLLERKCGEAIGLDAFGRETFEKAVDDRIQRGTFCNLPCKTRTFNKASYGLYTV